MHNFLNDRSMARRTFLKLTGAATAVAASPANGAFGLAPPLPSTPSPSDLASVPMKFAFTDLFQMPVFANEWGYGQASKSVTGVTGITFPPFACCGVPEVTWSPGLLTTCEISINGQLLSIAPQSPVTYRWLPQRVDREQVYRGTRIRTRTFMPVKQRAIAEHIELTNVSPARQKLAITFDLRAAVTKKTTSWMAGCPGEGGNTQSWNAEGGYLVFSAAHSKAFSVQGVAPRAQGLAGGHLLTYEVQLAPGETRVFRYANALADTDAEAVASYRKLQGSFDEAETANEAFYEGMLRAVFTPGNSYFSGHLPTLHTDDEALWMLYTNGIKNLLSARRCSPDSKYGPTYLTLGGHTLPTLSFPWDTSLTGLSLALLDPIPLRNLVEVWFLQPMDEHLATDYVSGTGVGPWYAVNDTAIVSCARDYLRVTGDFSWLDKKVGDKTVLTHLADHASHWETLRKNGSGLADYGNIENLLEVVSTYIHEVAGMNAGNVGSMRFIAELLDRGGESARAKELRTKSDELARHINKLLYVEGKGWWRARQPDGSFNEVRHCYDFLAIAQAMLPDLSPTQKAEMVRFFETELRSQTWMRALSAGDPDVTWNIRPDHSAIGAYASWPPMSAKALYRLGAHSGTTAGWLREVAKAGNQGPIGQAHFVEDVWRPMNGGAFKCPNDPPYINEWCCIAGGAFADMVIDTLFGVDAGLNEIHAHANLDGFDLRAELRGLRYHDKHFTVSGRGIRES
jgi:hypothetical protein